jgi:spore protease
MANFPIRTDLALEAREYIEEANGEMRGVIVNTYSAASDTVQVTHVQITTKNGAKSMGKPIGTYITLEADNLTEPDEDYHREVSKVIAKQLKHLLPDFEKEKSILVVGLGNRDVTADALGPEVVDHLNITRHMLRQFGPAAYSCDKVHEISSIVPGVMGKTGMETAEIIRGVVDSTTPDVIVVIDALAARSTRRLTRTIQITNTGIQPGSGVGNHRDSLTEESLGVPVIAIGIPTVVDAATIVNDAIGHLHQDDPELQNTFYDMHNMYVTAKDIDATIKRLGFTLSEALNLAFLIC